MRIIISAYECSPNHGSEAGLGWKWVLSSSRYEEFEEIHVITTDRYEKNIKQYISDHSSEMGKINFHFLPLPLSRLKSLNQRFKYIIWQWLVGNLAKEICRKEQIDFMHHVTWATCVLPTFLYRGNRPFVYGPIGGGERTPKCVDIKMSKRDAFVEWIRIFLADISVYFPANKRAYQSASLILSTTEETKNLIPKKFHSKVKIMQAIGVNELPVSKNDESDEKDFIVLLVARMLCWKGIDIAIETFKKMEKQDNRIKLLIVGVGRNFETYKHIAKGLSNIEFLGGYHIPKWKMYIEVQIYF